MLTQPAHRISATLAALLLAAATAHAADYTWTAPSGNWSDPANWQNNAVPPNANDTHVILNYPNFANFASTVDAARSTWVVNGITLNHATNILTPDTLTIDPASTLQFTGTNPYLERVYSSTPFTLNGAIDLTNGLNIRGPLWSQSAMTFNGPISGAGGIQIDNNTGGTYTFNGNNTFSGGLTLNASGSGANLVFASHPSLSTGDITINYKSVSFPTVQFQVDPGTTTTIANNLAVNELSGINFPIGVAFLAGGVTGDHTIVLQHLAASGKPSLSFGNGSVGKTTWNVQSLSMNGDTQLSTTTAAVVLDAITEASPSSLFLSGIGSTYHLAGANSFSNGFTIMSGSAHADAAGSLGSGPASLTFGSHLYLNATNAANNTVNADTGTIHYNANGAAGGHLLSAGINSNIALDPNVTSFSNGNASDTFSLASRATISGNSATLALLDRGIGSGTTPNFVAAPGAIIDNTDGNLPTIQNLGANADLVVRLHNSSPMNLTVGTGTPWKGIAADTFTGNITANSDFDILSGTFGNAATPASFNILHAAAGSPVVVNINGQAAFNSPLGDFSGVQKFVVLANGDITLNVPNALGGAIGTPPAALDLQAGMIELFDPAALNGPVTFHGNQVRIFSAVSGAGVLSRDAAGITFDIRNPNAFAGTQLTPDFTTAADTFILGTNNVLNLASLNSAATYNVNASSQQSFNLNGGKLALQLFGLPLNGSPSDTITIGAAGETISGRGAIQMPVNAQGPVTISGTVGFSGANQFGAVNLTQGELLGFAPTSFNGATINVNGGQVTFFHGSAASPVTYANTINILHDATLADHSTSVVFPGKSAAIANITLQAVNLSAATLTLDADAIILNNLTLLGDATITRTSGSRTLLINNIAEDATPRALILSTTPTGGGSFKIGTVSSTGPVNISNFFVELAGNFSPSTAPLTLGDNARIVSAATIHRPVVFTTSAAGTQSLSPGTPLLFGASTPGTLTVDALTLASTTNLQYNLSTPNTTGGGGTDNDLILVLSNLTLDGNLAITKGPNFGIGNYILFTYFGTFTDNGLSLPTPSPGFAYSLDLSTFGQVKLHNGFLGDANDDGVVNFADFVALSNHYGQANATWSDADFNNDHIVNFADFVILSNQYGQTMTGSALTAAPDELATLNAFAQFNAPAPEPATLTLLLPVTCALLRRKLPH